MVKKNNRIELAYSYFFILSLFFHVYNNLEIFGVKVFYIFVLLSIISNLFIRAKVDRKCNILVICMLLFCITSFSSPFINIEKSISFICIILACRKIPAINLQQIEKFSIYLLLVICICLFITYKNATGYRFQGFYNDPNYLCLSLISFVYLNMRYLKGLCKKNIMPEFLAFINILSVFILVLLTQSRTGLICYAIMIVIFLKDYILKNFIKSFVVLSLIAFGIGNYIQNEYSDEIDFFISRFDGRRSDDVSSTVNYRFLSSKNSIAYMLSNPYYIPFGLGIGSSELITKTAHRDHNTFTSCLSEQGLFSLFTLLLFLLFLFKKNANDVTQYKQLKLLNITTEFIFIIFSLSIWTMTYLPFWSTLFVLYNNIKIDKE